MRHRWRAFTRDDERGLTLVELLVVMIIIGILAAIAIPIFMNQQKTARDTALRSDMKNTATVVTSANLSPDEFFAIFRRNGVNVFGENSVHNMPSTTGWNDSVPVVPKITVSDGTVMAIFMYQNDSGGWAKMEEGEFCLAGVNAKSNYNYIPGSGGGASQYHKYLYYDVKYGGFATMDQLVKAVNSGSDISCTGHVGAYKTATGQ